MELLKIKLLRETFNGQVTSRKDDVNSSLLGNLNSQIYKNHRQSKPQLKDAKGSHLLDIVLRIQMS